jgi:hypothetical protein
LEASLTAQDLVRPWRRATLVASLIAGVELVLLLVCGALLVAKPLTNALRGHAQKVATTQHKAAVTPAPVHHPAKAVKHHAVAPPVLHPRAQTDVLVLNGNGENGAAHAEASKLQSIGYRVSGAENAKRHDYATTFVMYVPGYKPEAQRLANDLHVHVVGPLDGLKPSALKGGKLAVVLGAS